MAGQSKVLMEQKTSLQTNTSWGWQPVKSFENMCDALLFDISSVSAR